MASPYPLLDGMALPDKKWGVRMTEAKEAYAIVAKAIREFESVTMTARPEDVEEAREQCGPDI